MCFELFIVPTIPSKASPERLSRSSGLYVEKQRRPVAGALHVSVDGSCSCSLLSDDADWEASTWQLDPEVLRGLERTLRLVHDEAGGFTFQALWMGDSPETKGHAQLREVLDDVANNRVRNRHVYIVGKQPVRSFPSAELRLVRG